MNDYEKIIDNNIAIYEKHRNEYPSLDRAATPLAKPSAPILGRDSELEDLRLALRNPEKANLSLLGEPGSGKSALVQGFTYNKNSTQYLTLYIDVERLAQDPNADKDAEMANGLLDLVHETSEYSRKYNIIVVLFIDEFHRIAMISPSSVEALKPILEKSAHNGFRVIAATTFEEYDQWIAPNRALDQRLLRVDLPELPRESVINILKSRAKQYNVDGFASENIYSEIYDTASQILISNSQPRASIDILLNMVGNITKTEYMKNGKLVREYSTPAELRINSEYALSRPMLNRVIQRAYSIDIDNRVDINTVRQELKTRIFNQEQAVESVLSRLEMSLAGFNDPTRPKISILSTGTTGTGKALRDDELIPVPTEQGFVYNGDLKVGDYVFNRLGQPAKVTGVFPQGLKTIYRMTLADGRVIDCADDHLWTYKSRAGNGSKSWKTISTKELIKKNITTIKPDGRSEMNFVIPMNEAVERKARNYHLDPYVLGVMLGNGILGSSYLQLSSNDTEVVESVSNILGVQHMKESSANYTWKFVVGSYGTQHKLLQTRDVFKEIPTLIGTKSGEKFIPDIYKLGSVDQRWALIQGLFDTDGHIKANSRYQVGYTTTSIKLAHDIQEILWSLGIMSTITKNPNKRHWNESTTISYCIAVKLQNKDKIKFFRLSRKRDIAITASRVTKTRDKKFDVVSIRSIEIVNEKVPMTCIMIDDNEHLYQAGIGHIMTHNTEMAKVISASLGIPLKRFDMSRYSRPEDAVEFANELAKAAWSSPNAYILIDEAEKSTRECMNTLLQVLDDARLTSANNANRVISFSGNIINLTTNLGSEVYEHQQRYGERSADGSEEFISTELIYKSLADSEEFETAVLGRIDVIVPFKALPKQALARIAESELKYNLSIAETIDRPILISPDIIPYIVIDRTSKDAERGGARDTKRNMKNIVIQKLASYMAENKPEVPLIIRLDNTPRFRSERIGDPEAAGVTIDECYSKNIVDGMLLNISKKFGHKLRNDGLFIPKTQSPQDFARDIIMLIQKGVTSFKTTVNIEKVIIIDSHDPMDIANVNRFLS